MMERYYVDGCLVIDRTEKMVVRVLEFNVDAIAVCHYMNQSNEYSTHS